MRKRLATTLGGALLATVLLVPAAQAAQENVPVKATPNPFAGELPSDLPGCFGNLNATFNHGSGLEDPNPTAKDSKGPGWFFRDGQAFKEARESTRAEFCG